MDYISVGIKVIEKIASFGFEAYFVGGFVRDFFMGKMCNDIDITTSAKPSDIATIFDEIDDIGIKYNCIIVKYLGYRFEVTTYRKDVCYYDNRHPIVEVANSLKEDLIRRDFTCNALAMNMNKEIVDLFGGLSDINNKLIRVVGNPNIRFKEDSLRILRACYFAGKLDFNIEVDTFKAMVEDAHLVKNLSSERVLQELSKLIASKHSLNGLKWLLKSEVVNYIPCLKKGVEAYLQHKITFDDVNLFLTTCFLDAKDSLKYYNLSKKRMASINNMIDLVVSFKKNDYSNYLLSCYNLDELIKANILGSALGLCKDKREYIKEKYKSITKLLDKDIDISKPELNEIYNDWKKTDLVFSNIKKAIINGIIANNKEEILIYINQVQ